MWKRVEADLFLIGIDSPQRATSNRQKRSKKPCPRLRLEHAPQNLFACKGRATRLQSVLTRRADGGCGRYLPCDKLPQLIGGDTAKKSLGGTP